MEIVDDGNGKYLRCQLKHRAKLDELESRIFTLAGNKRIAQKAFDIVSDEVKGRMSYLWILEEVKRRLLRDWEVSDGH